MSRILAYTSPGLGHLLPLRPILLELAARGHEVEVRTLAAGVEDLCRRGLRARPIDPRIEALALDDWRARTRPGAIARTARTFLDRAPLDAADLAAAVRAARPDGLLVDIACWGALGAATGGEVPWGSFCPFPLPLGGVGRPPYGLGLQPGRGPLGRARDRLGGPVVEWATARIVKGRLDRVRAEFGSTPLGGIRELLLAGSLLIYMTAEPFEYPCGDWRAEVAMVGPCVEGVGGSLPEGVDPGKPLVLVTTSSEFQDDERLVRCALAALADEPLQVVATVPARRGALPRPPANATVLDFAPHGPLLAHAACAVTHGGMGATQKALAAGVPVCVVPFGRDQPEVALRVVHAGAGVALSPRRLEPARLRAAVRRAMTMRPGAERIARGFRAAGGARRAADAFEASVLGAG